MINTLLDTAGAVATSAGTGLLVSGSHETGAGVLTAGLCLLIWSWVFDGHPLPNFKRDKGQQA